MRVAIARHICIAALAAVGLAVGAWGTEPKPASQLTELADPAAAVPPVVNLAPGPEYSDQTRMFQGIPGIERAAGGRLWATWYGGGVAENHHNYVLLDTSDDDGRTWKRALLIDPDGDGPIRAFDPCLWHDPQGRLWLFWAQRWHGGGRGRGELMAIRTEHSGDADAAWSKPQWICDGIMMNKPTVAADGRWLLPVAIWEREGSARVVESTDNGTTWRLLGAANVPKRDREAEEHMIIQRKDGSFWMLVRTLYGIGESVSTDGGKTWSEVAPSAITHTVARFFIRRLNSGRLLLVKHVTPAAYAKGPSHLARSHLTAFLSDDDGKTWSDGLLLDARSSVSYPDGVQSPEGLIYLIYDFDRGGAKQILMAVFTEEDVLAGKIASPQGRLRVLVNQAGKR